MGGDSVESTGGDEATLHVRCSNGSKFSVQIGLDSTIGAFKVVLSQNCDFPANQQRLIYKGRILKDDQTLESYGLESDHTIHLVRGFVSASSTDTIGRTNPGGTNITSGNTRAPSLNQGGALGEPELGASLFPGFNVSRLDGNDGLFGEFDQFQRQLTQNPNMMREIMNTPAVQNIMNNPDLIRNMITSSPQMRQLIERNPELGHILNDPNTLRQTLEATRNPELMREMMRNTDRAMSNIESSPEGFNMLRRMYENVQEPFLNATTMAGDTGNDTNSNPLAALLGTQAQTRDPSTNVSSTGSETTTGSPAPNTNPLPNPWTSAGAAGGAQTNTAPTRLSPAGDARPTAAGGGLGLPDIERMLGSMQDNTNSPNQFMQNPAILQMMQSILSNPQSMNQMLSPQLRRTVDDNPQMREMLQNPEILRQLTSPDMMQQLMTVQQSLMSQLGRQQSTQEPRQAGVGTGTPNTGLEMLMNMFGGLGAGGLVVPNRSNVPPEELYATQLTQLQEMGFFDTQENIRALTATAGNVHAAVERLLGNPG